LQWLQQRGISLKNYEASFVLIPVIRAAENALLQRLSTRRSPEFQIQMHSSQASISEPILLTQFSKSSGCGCKIAPAVLDEILKGKAGDEVQDNLLVGIETKDDAAVLELNETDCIISTTDFFTPIVNDSFDFGMIAAANSISDIYAMGGKPVMAISVLGFPVDKLPVDIARNIIAGASETCRKAGISIAGGHSIDSPEPFFGLCVTGLVKKNHIKRNNTAWPGDIIFITKPLGTGILATALKRGLLKEEDYKTLFANASELNSIGEKLGTFEYIHALTDITGFGLLGHLSELCDGSKLSAEIRISDVPLLSGVQQYRELFCVPDNTYRNWNAVESKVEGITPETFITFNDPQTNGGLLIAVSAEHISDFRKLMNENNIMAAGIGTMIPIREKSIYLN
jgi:selenide,water dikinase